MRDEQDNIRAELLTIVSDFLNELGADRPLRALTADADFENELGIDSLGKVELFSRIEKKFNIKFSAADLSHIQSINELVKAIEHSGATLTPMKTGTFTPMLDASAIDVSEADTLITALIAYATAEPDRPHIYLQDDDGHESVITYGELYHQALSITNGLAQRGILTGETIAIMLPTSKEFFYCFFGILMAGAIPVPIYPPFRTDHILEYIKREAKILRNAEVRILITFLDAKNISNILRLEIPSLSAVDTFDSLKTDTQHGTPPTITADDAAFIQYTSGSTGAPKGVLLNHSNIMANIQAIGAVVDIKPTDVAVSWLPLYHDMGLMTWLAALYYGVPITIMSPLTFITRPEQWLWTIHYHRATLSGGPNFAYELCVKRINNKKLEGMDLSCWRFAFNGAETIFPATIQRFCKKFAKLKFEKESITPVYGLAEATVGLIFPRQRRQAIIDHVDRQTLAHQHIAKPCDKSGPETQSFVSVGEALPGHKIRIVDNNNQEVKERAIANLQFCGPSAMQNYYNNPEQTQLAQSDGWWNTGDLAYRVGKEIFITGRKKDLIIKAGRNIYPDEIEAIASNDPDIRKGCVAAFGVYDRHSGTEKLIVVAETHEHNKKRQQDIRVRVGKAIAESLDVPPDQIIIVPPRVIPKTSSGKLRRSECKKAYLGKKLVKKPASPKWQFSKIAALGIFKKITASIKQTFYFLYTLYIITVVILFILPMWLILNLLPKKYSQKLLQHCTRSIFRLSGLRIKISGTFPNNNNHPIIYVANHASYLDGLIMLAILPPNTGLVAKREVGKLPLVRNFLNKQGHLTVDRLEFSKSIEDVKKIEQAIVNNQSIMIFPEATFVYAKGIRPFKLGAFKLAVDTQSPICPITIKGTRQIFRSGSALFRPGTIKLLISPLIYPESKSWQEVSRLTQLTRKVIIDTSDESAINVSSAGVSKEQ